MHNGPLSLQQGNFSASALLASLNDVFVNNADKCLELDSVSTLVLDNQVPTSLIESMWRHSYKQSEDELLLLFPLHDAAHSLFLNSLSNFPGIDSRMLTAWTVFQPFLTAMSPQNLNQRYHNGVSAGISLNSRGDIVNLRLQLASQPLLNLDPLLNLPKESNWRSFDVFYHMLYSQQEDPDRAGMLSLKSDPSHYKLLRNSQTYRLPEWVTFADDYALAKDWADAVEEIFPKTFQRSLMMILSGILLIGNGSESREDLAEGASLIGLNHMEASKYSQEELLAGTYTALLYSVEAMLNEYLASLDLQGVDADAIYSSVTIAELASTSGHRYHVLRSHFDSNFGLNAELILDGLDLRNPPSVVSKAISKLSQKQANVSVPSISNFKSILDASAQWFQGNNTLERLNLENMTLSNRVWTALSVAPSNVAQAVAVKEAWASNIVSTQIRDAFVTEWVNRSKQADYTADYDVNEFLSWFSNQLPAGIEKDELASWAATQFAATDFFQGHHRIYLSESLWNDLEGEREAMQNEGYLAHESYAQYEPSLCSQVTVPMKAMQVPYQVQNVLQEYNPRSFEDQNLSGDYDMDFSDDEDGESHTFLRDPAQYGGIEEDQHIEVQSQTRSRKAWLFFVWSLTFWIPSPFLTFLGQMRRRDVRLAWREKVAIFSLIFLINAGIIFYMIFLGRFICPEYDKVWSHKELFYHQGTSDFYVAIHGSVYDITQFYRQQHSDNGIKTSASVMMPFAGLDLSDYFPPPLSVACPSLIKDESVALIYNTTRSPFTEALHKSGPELVPLKTTALHDLSWYKKVFSPKIKKYYKGRIVESKKDIKKRVGNDSSLYYVVIGKTIYDMSNYMQTINQYPASDSPHFEKYNFFPTSVTNIIENFQGEDISDQWNALDEKTKSDALECMNQAFVYGIVDFRQSAKCQAANVILLVFAGMMTSITVVKFLASLRFGSKPMPIAQDKFVLCQVPVYTEGEDDMRLAIDSLTNLKYDNRHKLLVLLCDGMVTGAGNDRPTPLIALDLLGIDESRVKAEPKAYHAVAEGSRELNFAKVYSGLYENEGDMVPFLCIVKVGTPNEQNPGNRGKRDSQIIVMNFLNRVHYGDPMCPLDLEIFHHLNNIIGIEPERFEYLLTIDADTRVHPDALNRMVATCTNDNSVCAVCGETGIENEQQSLSTMIQVYEYFISHHLTKQFESLFGSITCLPGCFSLYRLRTAQRSKPLLISSDVIREYSVRHIDTLHKKNLFSLGEDRYLTTLMAKHFSRMKMKFVADAKCLTVVPDDFSILLSQRRRWINSTVHNLAELLYLPTMCGFCLFSMRGIIMTDLIGTLMLPSVVIYLVYLIYVIASHTSPLPLISIILIVSVYGLQALVFIIHRRWQHIFWMIVYILAYPVHSFILPIYSFWNMDNFTWGNTRVILNETKGRKIVLQDDNDVYDPQKVPFEGWSSYATRNGLPGRERPIMFDKRKGKIEREVFEDPAAFDSHLDLYDQEKKRSFRPSLSLSHRQSTYSLGRSDSIYTLGIISSGPQGNRSRSETPFDPGTEAQIRDTIQQVLHSTDLDSMTSRQLRSKIGDLLGTEFVGERALAVDQMIDFELERLDEDAQAVEPSAQFFKEPKTKEEE